MKTDNNDIKHLIDRDKSINNQKGNVNIADIFVKSIVVIILAIVIMMIQDKFFSTSETKNTSPIGISSLPADTQHSTTNHDNHLSTLPDDVKNPTPTTKPPTSVDESSTSLQKELKKNGFLKNYFSESTIGWTERYESHQSQLAQ